MTWPEAIKGIVEALAAAFVLGVLFGGINLNFNIGGKGEQ